MKVKNWLLLASVYGKWVWYYMFYDCYTKILQKERNSYFVIIVKANRDNSDIAWLTLYCHTTLVGYKGLFNRGLIISGNIACSLKSVIVQNVLPTIYSLDQMKDAVQFKVDTVPSMLCMQERIRTRGDRKTTYIRIYLWQPHLISWTCTCMVATYIPQTTI